jgi:hypothetical protein
MERLSFLLAILTLTQIAFEKSAIARQAANAGLCFSCVNVPCLPPPNTGCAGSICDWRTWCANMAPEWLPVNLTTDFAVEMPPSAGTTVYEGMVFYNKMCFFSRDCLSCVFFATWGVHICVADGPFGAPITAPHYECPPVDCGC